MLKVGQVVLKGSFLSSDQARKKIQVQTLSKTLQFSLQLYKIGA
jgi:hypothetical protein